MGFFSSILGGHQPTIGINVYTAAFHIHIHIHIHKSLSHRHEERCGDDAGGNHLARDNQTTLALCPVLCGLAKLVYLPNIVVSTSLYYVLAAHYTANNPPLVRCIGHSGHSLSMA